MVSSEAKRTLVKSPPELWAELSDADSLARHLEAFEAVRITRVDPESRIEWEARGASGTVTIKPSGWGTQVMLSVERELPPEPEDSASPSPAIEAPDGEAVEPPAAAEPPAAPEEPLGEETPVEEQPLMEQQPPVDEEPAAAEAFAAAEPPPEPRKNAFARTLARFRARRAKPRVTAEPVDDTGDDTVDEPSAPSAEPLVPVAGEPAAPEETSQATMTEQEEQQAVEEVEETALERPQLEGEAKPPIGEELARLEEELARETAALLTTVLDRLGAAHHRPFSRG